MRKKCKRSNCKLYNRNMDNNCVGLCEVYENVYDCKFFKKKETQGMKSGLIVCDESVEIWDD